MGFARHGALLAHGVAILAVMALAAPVDAQTERVRKDDIRGRWIDHREPEKRKVAVWIEDCDGLLCGHIYWLKKPSSNGRPKRDQHNPDARLRDRPLCGLRILSGFKRAADGTCSAFEPLGCHFFLTESTFGLPVYRWQPAAEVALEINEWWRGNQAEGRTSVLFAYALGKAQRVLSLIDAGIGPIVTISATGGSPAARMSGRSPAASASTYRTANGTWSGKAAAAPRRSPGLSRISATTFARWRRTASPPWSLRRSAS